MEEIPANELDATQPAKRCCKQKDLYCSISRYNAIISCSPIAAQRFGWCIESRTMVAEAWIAPEG